MKVYLLTHSREVELCATSSVMIGIYSSLSVVDTTINKYKDIEGFKDYPDDFVVKEYEVTSKENNEILPGHPIYFLQHEYSVDEEGIIYDYDTDIGIFANYDSAKKVMEELIRTKTYPKSPDGLYAPDGFCISECIVDEDNWTEGFVVY